jgi:hypothetical protein
MIYILNSSAILIRIYRCYDSHFYDLYAHVFVFIFISFNFIIIIIIIKIEFTRMD